MQQPLKDDAALWFATQEQPIQDYEQPPMEDTYEADDTDYDDSDADDDEDEVVTRDDVVNQTNLLALNKPTAEVLVGVMDAVIPVVGVMLLKGSDSDDLKLTDAERETLVNAWAAYLGTKAVNISPGAALIVTILSIYGSKTMVAIQNRKQNDRIRELEAKVAAAELARQTAEEKAKNDKKEE